MKVEKTIDKRKKFHDKEKKIVQEQDKIWKEDEVKEVPVDDDENRIRPKHDCIYKQQVSPEDMFLGMSGMDPSTAKC